jgi:hypothetical protein
MQAPAARKSRRTELVLIPSSDAEFDALLETQRAEDVNASALGPPSISKRKREVITDHEYRLRKERTDSLLAGYQNVILRRSPRLRNKSIPDDLTPPPPFLDRGDESDGDDPDPDLRMVERVERNLGDLDLDNGKQLELQFVCQNGQQLLFDTVYATWEQRSVDVF